MYLLVRRIRKPYFWNQLRWFAQLTWQLALQPGSIQFAGPGAEFAYLPERSKGRITK